MKTFLLFFMIISLGISSCHKSVSPTEEFTTNIKQAKKWFNGTWKLVRVSAQIPNPPVPNVQLVISGNQILVTEDGKQTDKVNFEIVEATQSIQLTTNAQPRSNNWYLRNPILRISNSKMFLDSGVAYDLPGFEFEKVK